MGEITVQVEFENAADRAVDERGYIPEAEIRTYKLRALVDTGAVMLMLPQNVVEKLGLPVRRTVIVSYADERKEERPVAGPLTIKIGDRFMSTDCVVGPPLSEPLIGQIVLEELDLLADCVNHTLVPRPESPDYPLLRACTKTPSPLVGEGWGGGVRWNSAPYPPPCPSPTRGEGTHF